MKELLNIKIIEQNGSVMMKVLNAETDVLVGIGNLKHAIHVSDKYIKEALNKVSKNNKKRKKNVHTNN